MIDEGKLTWEDKAQKHLPDFKLYDPYMTKELTLADMLCHRSGLEDIGLLYFMSPLSRDQIIYQMRYLSSLSDFRVLAVYNNFMFLAAGQIVARVSGMSWDDFITQRFLQPLKMKDSVASIREFKNQAALAKPHMYLNGKTIAMTPLDLHNVGPAGSIISTANDLVNWVRLQLNNGQFEGKTIIKPETVKQMHSPNAIRVQEHPSYMYGFGWGTIDNHGTKIVSHKGSLDGASSIIGLIPDKKVGIIILTNLHVSEARDAIVNYIYDHFLGVKSSVNWLEKEVKKEQAAQEQEKQKLQKIEQLRNPQTKPSVPLNQYVSTYLNDLYGEMNITQEGDSLHGKFLFLDDTLQHWYDDVFMLDSSIKFPTVGEKFLLKFQVKNGRVDEVRITIANDREVTFKRK